MENTNIEPEVEEISLDDIEVDESQISEDTEDEDKDYPGLNQIDDILGESEARQKINEALVNQPTIFVVKDKELHVVSKTINKMVEIDSIIIELQKLAFKTLEASDDDDKSADMFFDEVKTKIIETYTLQARAVALIVDEELDWVMDNVDMAEGGEGDKIVDAYKQRAFVPVLKKTLELRMF